MELNQEILEYFQEKYPTIEFRIPANLPDNGTSTLAEIIFGLGWGSQDYYVAYTNVQDVPSAMAKQRAIYYFEDKLMPRDYGEDLFGSGNG
jgi:hypothetical protein